MQRLFTGHFVDRDGKDVYKELAADTRDEAYAAFVAMQVPAGLSICEMTEQERNGRA